MFIISRRAQGIDALVEEVAVDGPGFAFAIGRAGEKDDRTLGRIWLEGGVRGSGGPDRAGSDMRSMADDGLEAVTGGEVP